MRSVSTVPGEKLTIHQPCLLRRSRRRPVCRLLLHSGVGRGTDPKPEKTARAARGGKKSMHPVMPYKRADALTVGSQSTTSMHILISRATRTFRTFLDLLAFLDFSQNQKKIKKKTPLDGNLCADRAPKSCGSANPYRFFLRASVTRSQTTGKQRHAAIFLSH